MTWLMLFSEYLASLIANQGVSGSNSVQYISLIGSFFLIHVAQYFVLPGFCYLLFYNNAFIIHVKCLDKIVSFIEDNSYCW